MALGTLESSFDFSYFSLDIDHLSFDIIIFSFDFTHFSVPFFLRICHFFLWISFSLDLAHRMSTLHPSPPPTHLEKFLKSLTLHNRHLPLGTPIIWGGVTSGRSLWLNKRGGGTTKNYWEPQPQHAQRASLLKIGATKSDNLAGNQAIWESSNLTIQESSNLAMRVQWIQ